MDAVEVALDLCQRVVVKVIMRDTYASSPNDESTSSPTLSSYRPKQVWLVEGISGLHECILLVRRAPIVLGCAG
jgi:hypothetical protein